MNINIEVLPENVIITGIKVNLICRRCNHTWGVYLVNNQSLPNGGCICSSCKESDVNEKNKFYSSSK
jgi:hypothetical protein